MEIVTAKEGNTLTIALKGRLDTTSSPELEDLLKEQLSHFEKALLDLKDLEYISSAGLRVMLLGHKTMSAQDGHFVLKNPNEFVNDVFVTTGLDEVLAIE